MQLEDAEIHELALDDASLWNQIVVTNSGEQKNVTDGMT